MEKKTGFGLACTIKVQIETQGEITNKTYSILTDTQPRITMDEYKTYSGYDATQRAKQLCREISKNYTEINRPVIAGLNTTETNSIEK